MDWIKVEDKLPPTDKTFLCIVKDTIYEDKLIYFAYLDSEKDSFEGWTWDDSQGYSRMIGIGDYYRHKMTHWMPLPELPKD